MGLISRVSSRTYRYYFSFRESLSSTNFSERRGQSVNMSLLRKGLGRFVKPTKRNVQWMPNNEYYLQFGPLNKNYSLRNAQPHSATGGNVATQTGSSLDLENPSKIKMPIPGWS